MTTKLGIGTPILHPYLHVKFWLSYNKLQKPTDHMMILTSGTITNMARNRIVEQAMKHDCTHILFLDADMTFPSDMIEKLLEHDKDIVSGLYFQRDVGHLPVAMKSINDREYRRLNKHEMGGLVEVDAVGTGCLLVKREAFEKIGFPWFYYHTYDDGVWHTEDVIFCRTAKKKGLKIFVDTDVKCGHIISYEITEKDWVDGNEQGTL